MTYALSAALQAAVFELLGADADLAVAVGSNIFDALPNGILPQTYVLIGEEAVTDGASATSAGASHEILISVVTDEAGFMVAKGAASAICDLLAGTSPTLSRGTLTGIWFVKAKATRNDTAKRRQIDLRFRAFVEDN